MFVHSCIEFVFRFIRLLAAATFVVSPSPTTIWLKRFSHTQTHILSDPQGFTNEQTHRLADSQSHNFGRLADPEKHTFTDKQIQGLTDLLIHQLTDSHSQHG